MRGRKEKNISTVFELVGTPSIRNSGSLKKWEPEKESRRKLVNVKPVALIASSISLPSLSSSLQPEDCCLANQQIFLACLRKKPFKSHPLSSLLLWPLLLLLFLLLLSPLFVFFLSICFSGSYKLSRNWREDSLKKWPEEHEIRGQGKEEKKM